ncbi:tyrosine-type recombinase/integrase [Thermodesulfobacteriota bacterium]
MKTGGNANHPEIGARITVDPIRKVEDVKAIAQLTKDNPRDHLLFLMGVNNGLRAADLMRLKVKDVRYMKVGDTLTIRETKTQKDNVLVVNKTVHKALREYFDRVKPADDAFLFASRKGNSHLQSQAVSKLVKKWTKAINLRGNYGAHTLRKTWGYLQRTVHGVGFEIICKRYNHSSPAITMRYLGIQDREVHDTLMNEIG